MKRKKKFVRKEGWNDKIFLRDFVIWTVNNLVVYYIYENFK